MLVDMAPCTSGWSIALTLVVAAVAVGRAHAQWTERVSVSHAAFAEAGAPSALVHAPSAFDTTRPLHLVVYLHGYMGCAEVLMNEGSTACKPGAELLTGWNLARAHDAAGTNTLFVIPQLAFMKRKGQPGCFGRSGCFRSFISEILAALPSARLAGNKTLTDVAVITLVAHSAGYRTAMAILDRGDVRALIREVVLFDALYARKETFLGWIRATSTQQTRLVSLHTGAGTPAQHSLQLLRAARRLLGGASVSEAGMQADEPSFGDALASKRVVVARASVPHRQVPQAYLGRVLALLFNPLRH
jgi:hypothetical protein